MLERLEYAVNHAGMTQTALSKKVGLSPNFVSSTLSKARKSEEFQPDLKSLRALARVAKVSLRWLERGEGDPDDVRGEEALDYDPPTEPVRVSERGASMGRGVTLTRGDYPAHLMAMMEAYKRGEYDPEDVIAAMVAASEGRAMLPSDHEAAVRAMDSVLRATHQLRREGADVTMDAIAWTLARIPTR